MPAKPTTVPQYLAALPKDRRDALQAVRRVIRDNIDSGFKEGIQYGFPGYFVPHSVYPQGYHCDPTEPLPFVGIASQKNHMGLYLFCIYTSADEKKRFVDAWKATGKKLDMGASCVRFKKIEDVPLDVLAKTIKRIKLKKFIASYEASLTPKQQAAREKAAKKK